MAKKDKEKEKKNISQAEESDAKIRQQRKADFTAAKRATEPTSIQKKVRKTAAKAAAEGLSEHILSGNALREKKKTNAAAPDPTFGTGTVRVKASKDGTKAELDMPKKAVSSWVKSDAAKRGGQKLASEPMSAEEKKLRQRLSSAAASAAREDADRLLTKSFRDRMNKTAKAVPDPTFGTNMFSDKISDTGVKNYVQGEAERENEKFRRKLSSAAASAAKERADRLLTKNFRDRMENIPLQNTLDPTFGTNMLSDKISDTGVKNYIQSEAEKRRIAEIENERQRARKANLKDIAFNSAKRGFIQSRYGQECFKEMMGQKNNKKYYEDLLKSYDYNFEPDKWYEKAISGAMELVGQQARQWTDTKTITGAATAATMAAAAGQMGPQVAFPEEIVTVPAAFATGMTVGSTSANFEIEAGLAYNEMVENGVSANTARRIALAVGTGNAALEALQIDDLLKSVKILNKSAATKPTAKKIAKYLSERGAHIASETAQEVMQEGVTATGANIGSRIEKGKWEYSAGDVAQRLGETALSSALSFGAAGFGGDIVNVGKSRLLGTGINSAEGQAQNSEPIHEKQGNEKAFTQSAEENARKYTQTEKQTEQSTPPPKNAQRAQSAEDIITTIKKDPGEGGVRLALLRSGFTGADDAVLARDIIDFARGKKLTDGQRRRMSTNGSVMRVTEAIAASPETMEAIRNRYAEAQSRAETVRGENKTGEKYKIDYTTDNRPVVVVENDFLKGVDPKDYARETKKVLSGFKPGIPVKGRFVTVSRSSVMEYLHSKSSRRLLEDSYDTYTDKMRLAKNIDEVINASTDYVNEPNNHSRTDDIKEFARGNVLFEAGENQYSADVIIAQTKDGGMKLYDVVNIEKANFKNKKKDSSNTGSAQESALPNRPELSFNNSIAQENANVNGENLTNEGGSQRLDPRTPIEEIRRTMGEDAAMTELFRRESGLFQTAGRNGDDFETLFSQAPLRMVDRRAAETAYRAGIKDRFYAAGENGESFESVRGFAPERMQAAAAEAYQKGLDSRARNAEQIYSGETREGGGYGRADASGKQPGLVWNEEAQQLTPQERKNIAALARKLGKRVYIQTGLVTDDGRPALGKINDAAIYADPSRGTLVQDIIVHEFSHRMKQLSPDSWQKYADYAINDLKKTGKYDGIYSEFTKHYDGMAESEIHEEMAADYAYKMFDSEESLTELIRQDKPLAEKIKDVWFALLEKLGRDVTLKRAKNMWKMCLTEAGKTAERGGNQSGTKYMLNPNFNKAVDNWNDNLERRTGMSLLVGETSEPLMSIGVKKQKIYWDTTKINKTLNDHPDLDIDVIKSVPYLLENPVLIMQSKNPGYRQGNNRISLYGDLYNRNGIPVVAILELEPNAKNVVLDEIKIASTHARTDPKDPKSMKPTAEFIKNHTIKYVDPDKKRTAGWLARTERYWPFLPADSGSIGTIAYKHGVVKGENSSNQGKNMLPFEGGQREFTRTEERHAGQRAYKPTDTMTAREWQTERRNGNTVDAASLREIADIVRNDFGIPVSKEHFENENVTGIFNEMPETIRTAVTNDIVTVAHEVGHLLDRKLGLEDSPHLQQAFDMIDRDFAMNYSGKEIKGEAVSEFIRTYIKNKDEAKAAAPDFYEDFESRIRGTEYEKPLARLADSVNAYLSAGATERINLALAPEESKKTALKRAAENKAKMGEVFARFQNDWVDSFYGIKRAETLLQVKEKGKYSPYVLATNSRNAASKAAYILTQKFVDHEGNEIGDSFIDCLNPLNSKNRKQRENNLSELNRYLILKHALEWIEPQNGAKQKRVFADPTLENPDVIRSEIERIEKNVPQVREAAERIYEYQRNLMQIYGVESGGISQQTADDLRKKYPCYVPFIRQSEKKKTMRARSTIANQRAPVMHAFGGGELIVNPLESIIGKTESYVKFAARNSAMRALTDIADSVPGSGFVIEKLGGDMLRHVQTTDNADARLSEAKNRLNTAEGIPQEFNGIEDVGSWESLIKRGTEYVSVMKDGKKQYYQVHDKELLRSIADMSPNQLNGFLKFSRMILNIRKLFITQLSYLFSTTNPARDSKTAWNNMNINNPAQFVGEYFSALASVIKKDESYRRWCAMGGGQSSELSANIDEISRSMSKAMNGRLRYAIENPTKIFSEIFGAVADLNDIMESTPRLMAFKNEMKRSGDVQQAIYEADDVTSNFKRMGIKGRAANSMFMFANAQIQGLDRGIRSFTDASAGERTARIAKYVIGAMLMAALKQWWNREKDEDGYNKLSNYMKNAHTIIALGNGSFLRIPNAREQSLASAALDRAMDYFKGDKEAFDGFIGFAVDNLMPPFIPVPTDINGKSATDIFTDCILEAARNTMFGTATDFMANKNFTGSPIVPEAYSDLPPEQQYNERTTKPAIWLGKKLKDSPMRLDYIINNNLGIFGNINKALLPNDDAQRDKTLGFKNRWTADAYYSTDILNREYEAKDAADMELKRSNTPKNAEDYYGKLEKTTYISQMNGAINEMPQDEKRGARKRLLDVVTGWSAADAEVSDELRRLYKKTGENRFWQTPDRTFNVNGEEISLSPKKYERFALEARENFDKNAAELINSKLYKSLNDAEKAEAMQSVREYTVAAGRKDADRNYSLEKWQAGVYSGDISLNDSISEKVTKKRTEAAKERKRAEISIDTKNATGYTKEQAERLTSEAAQYYANKEQDKNYVGTNTYAHMEKYENTLKKYMPLNDYLQIRTGYYAYKESIGKRDKSSLKKQELTAYINSCTDSREVRRALFDALPHGGSKNPY